MRCLFVMLGVLLLAGGCATASGQDIATLHQRYSRLQALNNAAYDLANTGSHSPTRLREAMGKLKLAQAAARAMQDELAVGAQIASQVQDRRNDNLHLQADVYAQLGDEQAALDALDALIANGIWAGWKPILLNDKYLDGLHDDPRFKTLLSTFDAVASRWNTDAFTAQSDNLSEAQRIAGLSLFWSEARYNFVYFDHVPKLDWNQAYLDFLPKVLAAKSLRDYYDVLMRFAPLLHDGHTNVYPPESIANQFDARPAITTALIQNKVIVTSVDSPGVAALRLHVGDEIVSIDGQEVHEYARKHVAPYVSSATPQDRAVRMYNYQLLAGDHAKPVTIEVKDASGKPHMLTLSREPDSSANREPAFHFRMLPGDIAYLSLGAFENDKGARTFEQNLRQILRAKALILDVRNNGGGSSRYGWDVLTWLSSKPIPKPATSSLEYVAAYRAWHGPAANWKHTDGLPNTYSNPRQQHYTGPVAVLIGPQTFSAAEDFVVSFEAMKRGILVGQKTAGSTGQPLRFNLPGGGSARICTLRERFPDGRKFIGKGIDPQIEVEPTASDIRDRHDAVIATAVKALLAESATSHN